jgi:hypothetical protein
VSKDAGWLGYDLQLLAMLHVALQQDCCAYSCAALVAARARPIATQTSSNKQHTNIHTYLKVRHAYSSGDTHG